MPAHRYRPVSGKCRLCDGAFECVQSPSEAPHRECPKCGQEVERLAADTVFTPRLLKPLSVTDAKAAGFTVLRRTSDGSFERQ
jgi:putative FmdB family regulatory protein